MCVCVCVLINVCFQFVLLKSHTSRLYDKSDLKICQELSICDTEPPVGCILQLHIFKMASKEGPVCQIFSFQDWKASPDPILELPVQYLTHTPSPIVIDNGSFQTRAGWAAPGAELDPPRLLFKSVAARSRGAARSETQIGNDIPNLEPLRWLLKSQFDRNVVVNFEIQELIFDYVFTHLGITSEVSGS